MAIPLIRPRRPRAEGGAPSPRGRGLWRVWLLTVMLGVLAAGVYVWAVRDLLPVPAPIRIPLWALTVMFFVAELLVVHVEFRRDAFSFSLSEIPLVLGLFFAQPVDLIVGQVIGAGLALVLQRRQPPVKVAFNLSHLILETGVALVVFHALVGLSPMGVAGWVGALAAALVAAGIADVAVWMAISLADREWRIDHLFQGFVFGKVAAAANASVGLAAVIVLWREPLGVWVLVVPVATVMVAYQAYTNQRRKQKSIEHLYETGRALQRSVQLDTTIATLLEQARRLFRAEIAGLTFLPGAHADLASRTLLGPGEEVHVDERLALAPTEGVWARVASEGRALLLARPIGNERLRVHFGDRGIRDAMVAPIHVEDRVVGVLEVANRTGEVGTFDEEDLKLFETLAGNGSFAIENARLVARLEESLDRLTESTRVKDDFVSTVSHELRTPLTIIQGFIKTLLSNEPTFEAEERRRLLEAAERGARRLRELIEQLLMVSRLESESSPLRLEPVAVAEVIEDAVRDLEDRRDGRTLEVHLAPDLPPVLSDRSKLHRIVASLLDNALKHSRPDGAVSVVVRCEEGDVTVSVSDEGPGIPRRLHGRIFERFFQVDSSTTREAGGTGVGLYIARRLAEEIGARLWLERSDEQGSDFRVSVPATTESEPAGGPSETAAIG